MTIPNTNWSIHPRFKKECISCPSTVPRTVLQTGKTVQLCHISGRHNQRIQQNPNKPYIMYATLTSVDPGAIKISAFQEHLESAKRGNKMQAGPWYLCGITDTSPTPPHEKQVPRVEVNLTTNHILPRSTPRPLIRQMLYLWKTICKNSNWKPVRWLIVQEGRTSQQNRDAWYWRICPPQAVKGYWIRSKKQCDAQCMQSLLVYQSPCIAAQPQPLPWNISHFYYITAAILVDSGSPHKALRNIFSTKMVLLKNTKHSYWEINGFYGSTQTSNAPLNCLLMMRIKHPSSSSLEWTKSTTESSGCHGLDTKDIQLSRPTKC